MVVKAKLIDITKCIGCRACQVACKRWNDRQGVATTLSPEWTNPLRLNSQTLMHVRFYFKDNKATDHPTWRFFKYQCMQCDVPPCLYVCPTSAIYKRPDGVVHTYDERCVGCGSCVIACPYDVRNLDPVSRTATYKCHLCFDRIDNGLEKPACVQACPTGTLDFGEKNLMITKARARARETGAYLFGDEEEYGNSVIYVSDVPFEELNFPTKEQRVVPSKVQAKMAPPIGGLAIAGVVGLIAINLVSKRRSKLTKPQKPDDGENVNF